MPSLQMKITSDIFEAHLKCPTKCWLRTTGEPFSGAAYAEWVRMQSRSYRATKTELLAAQLSNNEFAISPTIRNLESSKWRAASSVLVQARTDNYVLESELHAIERVSSTTKGHLIEFIPIRFVSNNKIGKDDKLLLGFDAYVVSKSLGRCIRVGKVIHGDDSGTLRVNVDAFTSAIEKHITQITALLSNPTPPELVLNRHCAECEFRNRCRQHAKETDDLSLLSGMSGKERAQHRSKGIFTVAQLSYTFRPRRTPKRAKNPAKPHHFSLQALAIRDSCVYIHGSPMLPDCKSKVYLDIEGLPDRDYCYLIGALIVTEEGESFYSFWADTESDEASIFCQLAETISHLPDYRVFHYGDYDAAAMKRVAAGLSSSYQEQFASILKKCVNVLSTIYPHVYFPTYSNSLKEILPSICQNFDNQRATGLDSIVWRMQWESDRDTHTRTALHDYNKSDCRGLMKLTDFITCRISKGLETTEDVITVNRTEKMQLVRPHWQIFTPKAYAVAEIEQICKSAYFDYQREKVLIRTQPQLKSINRRAANNKSNLPSKINRTILFEIKRCPDCKCRKLNRDSESSHIEVDLKFSKSGVKKYVTRYILWRYRCEKCGKQFEPERPVGRRQKLGHSLACWCIYQNNVLEVSMLKVRKSLLDVFGLHINQATLHRTKDRMAVFYERLYAEILSGILSSPVIHIDETTIKLQKTQGYVWVLTTFDKVYYLYRPTREAEFLQEMLAPFHGVLVSDFFTGYDSLPCGQQKCLIHLVRDIDDDLLRNPFDVELKLLAQSFGSLLRSIISTIDRFGLRRRHLKKHKREVEGFLNDKAQAEYTSELANKYGKRFKKYGSRMFTFLDHDDVPWNNNNAEYVIKKIAKHRRNADGRFTENSLKEYLILASVINTCELNSVNVLKFLRSKEQTIEGLMRLAGRRVGSRKPSENATIKVSTPATSY
jgi:predicted RecB family nuclease